MTVGAARERRVAERLIRLGSRAVSGLIRLAAGAAARGPHGAASPLDPASSRRVLIVAIDQIGDAVLLSPFLRELRRNVPGAHLTLVVQPGVTKLFAECPYLDEVLGYDPHVSRWLRPLLLPLRARAFARRHLRAHPIDLAVVPRWDVDQYLATAVALFSGARQRVGYSERVNARKQQLNAGYDRLLTHVVSGSPQAHEVERGLELVRFLGGSIQSDDLDLWVGAAERRAASALLGPAAARTDRPLVALGIGARHPRRRWPLERYAELAQRLQMEANARIVIVGGGEDVPDQELLLRRLGTGAVGLCGRTSLRETVAVMERCHLFVGNDSAPMHLAAAAGAPVIEISCHPSGGCAANSNSPARFGPWKVPAVIHQPPSASAPCTDACRAGRAHCILQISAEEVFDSSSRLLQRLTVARNPTSSEQRFLPGARTA